VLDEPFARLEARSLAALAMVLESFSRRGHQVIAFTRQKEAAERMVSVGADVREIVNLRCEAGAVSTAGGSTPSTAARQHDGVARMGLRRRKKKPMRARRNGESKGTGQSDAA
jgi:hypothetical protein